MGPRKQIETEVYGRGIQSIDCAFDVKHATIIMVEVSGFTNETLCEVCVYAPVTILVCVSQSVT